MKKKITIIDYGAGNILSVRRSFIKCGASVEVLTDIKKIENASYLVLPGDGSFSFAANQLKKKGIFDVILKHVNKGNPLLGICLGMQLLMSKSEEFGKHFGLSIIKGKISIIKSQKQAHLKIPVIGWHPISLKKKTFNSKKFELEKFNNKVFYFVHSFHAVPKNENEILAYYEYGDEKITAIIGRENVLGTQFHPEKSGQNGINIIKTFLSMN
jgi:glutamine amidotransferase